MLNRLNRNKYKLQIIFRKAILVAFLTHTAVAFAQTDTLRVMAYNVLDYGAYPVCQGPNSVYHNYLKTIVQYTNPDILGLEKMGSIRLNVNDFHGNAPLGFGDSILQFALNMAYPGRYAYCPFTNTAQADNMSVLFYDQQKLGFVAITCSYSNITDFNTYKLYYKDPNLSVTHDTTFLYVVLNHTQSGSTNDAIRGAQIIGEMQQIQSRFYFLPNMINMGDFNTRTSSEICYQALINPANVYFSFYDPLFAPDNVFTYPASWESSTSVYTAALTTSTRQSATVPNSCGTNGGGKSWYDHIFLSSWILNNKNYISYIPHSYRTIGNDGHRLGVSVNDNNNTSAPANVIDALFQMSNKYPVMVDLLVTRNSAGTSPADPEINTGIEPLSAKYGAFIVNPVTDALIVRFTSVPEHEYMTLECYDITGKVRFREQLQASNNELRIPCSLNEGIYFVRLYTKDAVILQKTIKKQ